MIRLVPLDPTTGLSPVELRPGTHRFGRAADNDLVLPEASISSHHGELTIADGTGWIRDLGSTNGTFVAGERVTEAELRPAQPLRLGSVEFMVEAAAPAAPAARAAGPMRLGRASAAPAPPAMTPPAAPEGPTAAAEVICQKCGGTFPRTQVKSIMAGNRTVLGCPKCGAFCVSLAEHAAAQRRDHATFGQRLTDAFRYPLRGSGLVLLLGGTVFFGLLGGAQSLLEKLMGVTRVMPPMVLAGYIIVVVLSTGYLVACLQGIINSSAGGEDELPDWPEVSEFWSDIAVPFLRFLAVTFVLLGPGLVGMVFSPLVGLPMLLLGLVCAPMAMLTVAMADSISGLNPFVIFSGIAKVPGAYVAVWLLLMGLLLVAGVVRLALGLLPIPVLPVVAGSFLTLYALCVGMRALGVMYYSHRDRLNWF